MHVRMYVHSTPFGRPPLGILERWSLMRGITVFVSSMFIPTRFYRTYVHTSFYAYIHVRTVCTYVRTPLYVYVHMYILHSMYMYICTYSTLCICTYILHSMYMYVHTPLYVYRRTYICTHVCIEYL